MDYTVHEQLVQRHAAQLAGLPVPLRDAALFRIYLEEIPLSIEAGDVFAGRYGYDRPPTPRTDAFLRFPVHSTLTAEEQRLMRLFGEHHTVIDLCPLAHTCADYGTVLREGLEHYLQKAENALAEKPDDAYLAAMRESLRAAAILPRRFAALAREKLRETADEREKADLLRMARALEQVPMHPARDLYEAVQSVWLLHTLIPIAETAWYSISLGRLDQYLFPFYQRAVEAGTPKEEIKRILKHLFLLLDSYGDGACALNIGGLDGTGEDMTNDLTLLLIEVEKECALRAPIFAVRVSPKTPEAVWDALIDFDLFRIGQPTFYGELPCRAALVRRGLSAEDAAGFAVNSCMGLMLPGREIANMWGIMFNTHLALELAVCGGAPLHAELGFALKTAPKDEYASFDELLEQFRLYDIELMALCAGLARGAAETQAATMTDPFWSALTAGCIEAAGDRVLTAEYNTVTVEMMGLVNTCNALQAIRTLVFEEKAVTLRQLADAARQNYEGQPLLRKRILECKKYGENDPQTDALCAEVSGFAAEACQRQNGGHLQFLPSLHTLDNNTSYGAGLGATLDGRLAGEPVAKNADPAAQLQRVEHTRQILSAAALRQCDFSGGQPIDLYFQKSWFATKELRDKIKALIKTYFSLGGLQVQVNSVDISLLEKANRDPERYPYVIVRRGGYSVRFCEMPSENREDLIRQAKAEEAGA